jgi:uncharacterized damage-inducible protein DinB
MSNRDFFVERWNAERPAFMKVLTALPEGKQDYKPHERNNSASDIAWAMALEVQCIDDLLTKGEIEWPPDKKPSSFKSIATTYEKNADAVVKRLRATDDKRWDSEGRFMAGGKPFMTARVQDLAWFLLFDAIHHRGQLTAYIRPMGGKVPAVYGPSGDDQGS